MGSSKLFLVAAAIVIAVTATLGAAADAHAPRVVVPPLADCLRAVKGEVKHRGRLTVATSYPALSPWFVNNAPANQKGYESAIAYRIAKTLGFRVAQVTWYSEPYELSQTAGTKPFDFDINEFVYDARLTRRVSFSSSYFNVNQSIVALKNDAVVAHHAPADLRTYQYGVVRGSSSVAFAIRSIKPTRAPMVYATMANAIAALDASRIDAIVVDVPTGQYLATQQIANAVQVGQFRTNGERYVLQQQHRSRLTGCVDSAIATMALSGTLTALAKQWLKVYNSIPVLAP